MKDYKELTKRAKEQGWRVRLSRNGHLLWQPPDGRTTIVSAGTTASGRGLKNHIARMVRSGFEYK
jgi:predicted RNA binding protein YcfA (HicA-like mRNA interferase family)